MAGLTWPILVTDGASGPLGKISVAMDRAAGTTNVLGKSLAELSAREAAGVQTAVRHAEAMSTVGKAMADVAGESTAVRRATLGVVASQDRLTVAMNSGKASVAQLADAQAGLIASQERLAAAQKATTASATRAAVANREVAASAGGMKSGFAGAIGTAKQLGLVFGAFELVKKGIDITKEANEFHRAMVQTQTTADVTASEVNKASSALLDMSGKVAASPNDLATAWYHAKSVGLDYATSLKATQIAAEGARIGNASVEETMNALTASVASGIPGVKDMGSAMGQLLAIVGSGDMSLSDLNKAFSSGLLINMKQYGLSLTDVGAALATFGDHNVRGANAATMLRLSVQALAVPAKAGSKLLGELGLTSEGSAAALEKVHLTTGTLAKDLQSGGLNKAVLDLKKHLHDAGISTKQTGEALTEMFGKKAGPGIAILIGDTGRLEQKFKILRDSGASFDEKWKATTQTASFVLSSLGHQAEAAGIKLTAKLGPSIATVARFLGAVLPEAVHLLTTALAPFGQAWDLLVKGFEIVAPVAGAIGHVLSPIAPVLKQVAAAALTAYLAFKGYTMIRAAMIAISIYTKGALLNTVDWATTTVAANRTVIASNEAVAASNGAVATTTAARAGSSGILAAGASRAALGYAALAVAIGAVTSAVDKGNRVTPKGALGTVTGSVKTYTALSKGFIPDELAKISTEKAEKAAAAINKEKFAAVGGAAAARELGNALGVSGSAYAAAQKAAKSNTDQTNAQTLAFQLANDAASLLQNALNGLAGINLSVAAAQTGVASANLAVASSFKTNGDAIRGVTAKAVANQQAIQGQVSAAQQYAEAVGKQTGSSKAAVRAFAAQKRALEDQLASQHRLTPAVQAYIDRLYNLSNLKVPPTKLDADKTAADKKIATLKSAITAIRQNREPRLSANTDAGRARIAQLQAQIAAIKQGAVPTINVDTVIAAQNIAFIQQQLSELPSYKTITITTKTIGSLGNTTRSQVPGQAVGTRAAFGQRTIPPNTRFTVGEKGWEGGVTDAQGRTSIFSHAQSMAMGYRPPVGYAAGTGVASAFASLLASLGVGRAGQAGALGNGKAESNFNTRALNSIGALGMFQWLGGRKAGLERMASRMGVGANTEKAQLAFFKKELTGPFRNVLNGLRKATSARAAATLFNQKYEISGDNSGNRENNAARIYQQLKSGRIGVGGVPVAGVGVGRGGPAITTSGSGKKETWTVGGTAYASLRAAENAQRRLAKQLGNLRVKINGSDLDRLKNSLKSTAYDVKQAFSTMLADLTKAGASKGLLKMIGGLETRLLAVKAAAAKASDLLARMKDYRSGIVSTLSGAFDPTKAGSITDMVSGLSGATGTNNTYASQLHKLRGEAKGNKTLLGFINTLAASGETASLSTLAGASKGDLAQVSKAVGAYNGSLASGADQATAAMFGGNTVANQQKVVDRDNEQMNKIVAVVGKLAHGLGHQKIDITLDGKHLAAHVVNSKEMTAVLAELEHLLAKGAH